MNLLEWPRKAKSWTLGALTNSDLFVSGRFWIAVSVILPIMFLTLSYLLWNWLSDSQLGLWTEANVVAFYSWLNADESPNTTIRNVGFVIAGLVALPLTIWRSLVADRQASAAQGQSDAARHQADIARRGLLSERYQRGAGMLGSKVLSVRLGGIYALQRLAEKYTESYHVEVMKLLCAFVRHPTEDTWIEYDPVSDGGQDEQLRRIRADVEGAMQAIGSRSLAGISLERSGDKLYLRDANLSDLQVQSARLSGAWLTNAKLSGAVLPHADLSSARLRRADLTGVKFWDADLSKAILRDAKPIRC